MNRCNLTKDFLRQVKEGLRGKKVPAKIKHWIKKWKPDLMYKKAVWYKGKPIVAKEDTPEILRRLLLEGGCPLSIEGCFNYILPKMWGFPRRLIRDYIQSTERYQLLKVRTRDPAKARAVNSRNKEGSTAFLQNKKYYSGPTNHLAIDLMEIVKEWSGYRYFFACVHSATKRCWFKPMSSKSAQKCLTTFKNILKEVNKDIGEVTELSSDQGKEFVNKKWAAFLNRKGITHRISDKAHLAEKKIQEFGRVFGYLITVHGFKKSLELSLRKLNNVKSRVTGKAPSAFSKNDLLGRVIQKHRKLKKRPKHKKAVVFKKGDVVRYALKHADPLNIMYKSYTSISRKPKYANWSKVRVPIEKVKSRYGERVYQITVGNKTLWKKPWQLSLSPEVRQLVADKVVPEKGIHKPVVEGPVRKVKSLDISLKGWDLKNLPRMRARKKVKYS